MSRFALLFYLLGAAALGACGSSTAGSCTIAGVTGSAYTANSARDVCAGTYATSACAAGDATCT
ncbi:MAG: hypothetical protein QM765_07475 [Myxococcales bacterium]